MSTLGEAVVPAKVCDWRCGMTVGKDATACCKNYCEHRAGYQFCSPACANAGASLRLNCPRCDLPISECHQGAPSPAQTSGEGRELTFVEACRAAIQNKDVEWSRPGVDGWRAFNLSGSFTVLDLSRMTYRLKPAPAPGRCAELARDESDRRGFNDDWAREREDFGERLVREAAEFSADLEWALRQAGFVSPAPAVPGVPTARPEPFTEEQVMRWHDAAGSGPYWRTHARDIAAMLNAREAARDHQYAEALAEAHALAQRRAEQIARLEEAAGIERRRHAEELARVRREALEEAAKAAEQYGRTLAADTDNILYAHDIAQRIRSLAVPGGAPAMPTRENCPACAKVARHPGEGYVCALHLTMSGPKEG